MVSERLFGYATVLFVGAGCGSLPIAQERGSEKAAIDLGEKVQAPAETPQAQAFPKDGGEPKSDASCATGALLPELSYRRDCVVDADCLSVNATLCDPCGRDMAISVGAIADVQRDRAAALATCSCPAEEADRVCSAVYYPPGCFEGVCYSRMPIQAQVH